MSQYQIITDSACDLTQAMLQERNVITIPLTVNFRGQERTDSVEDADVMELYDAMRGGEVATTSAVNPDRWASVIEPVLAAGQDVFVLAFSSGLSTTYQSAVIAANELKERYPDRSIRVVDSRAAALGQGLLLHYVCKKRDEGLSLDELATWTESARDRLGHWFTVDDLVYLKRGGRVSAATAVLGAMLNIKPVLHVDNDGHLISMEKARGRKAAIAALATMPGLLGGQDSTFFICHADCLSDAENLAAQLKENYGAEDIFIGNLGAVIGSHSDPGTLAVFFLGDQK